MNNANATYKYFTIFYLPNVSIIHKTIDMFVAIKIRPSESLSSHTVVCFDDHFSITLRSPPRTITIINTNGAPIAQEYVNVLPGILMEEETSHPVGAAIFKN